MTTNSSGDFNTRLDALDVVGVPSVFSRTRSVKIENVMYPGAVEQLYLDGLEQKSRSGTCIL